MSQKTYQKLGTENLEAAEFIWGRLRIEKAMSQKTFEENYCYGRGFAPRVRHSGSFHNLYQTTQKFLFDHGLMTKELINGLIVYVATQKCWRSKSFENATREVQSIYNDQVDDAIKYVITNNGEVPAEYEAPIVANILGLERKSWKDFVATYIDLYPEDGKNMGHGLPIKFKVLGPVHTMAHQGLLKIIK